MPPTTAELVQGQVLGQLVDHRVTCLVDVAAPLELARGTVREALKGLACEGRVDDAVLVTDELVANAVRHAGGAVSLTLDFYEKGLLVGVADRGTDTALVPAAPVGLPADPDATVAGAIDVASLPEEGQGLVIVSRCAAAWGVERTEGGKVVTAVFDLAGGAL